MAALATVLLLCLPVGAQSSPEFHNPKLEVFAGYELFRVTPSSRVNVFRPKLNVFDTTGAIGAAQFNVNSYLGVVGEFGATRSGSVSLGTAPVALTQTQYSFLFGPRMFVHITSRISPFFELLLGGVHTARNFVVPNSQIQEAPPPGITAETGPDSTRFHTVQNAFAAGTGFGLNVSITKLVAVRPLQLDYIGTHLAPLHVPGVPAGINDSRWQMNWRYSAGVTFQFGGGTQKPALRSDRPQAPSFR